MPATYADDSVQDLGSTPTEIDYRDSTFSNNGSATGGHPDGVGISMYSHSFNGPQDLERVRIGASATPPYGDPNRWEQANLGWGGTDVKYASELHSFGARVPAASATDPGGVIAVQLHMTQQIDDNHFTVFSRGHALDADSAPFNEYTNDNPWGNGGTSGVVSETHTIIPSTSSWGETDIDWMNLEHAINVSLRRPSVEPVNTTVVGTPTEQPGSTLKSDVFGTGVVNTVYDFTEFLQRGEVTDPDHPGYNIPGQTDIDSLPINRNGEIERGTVTTAHRNSELADEVKYFTLRNPSLNVDAGRYPDYFTLYISDPGPFVDTREHPVGSDVLNRFWKFTGDIGGASGSATSTFTVPYIQTGNRSLSDAVNAADNVTAQVAKPFLGALQYFGADQELEWELVDTIIGTDSVSGGVTEVFDYQNQDFNWFNVGNEFGATENFPFYWVK